MLHFCIFRECIMYNEGTVPKMYNSNSLWWKYFNFVPTPVCAVPYGSKNIIAGTLGCVFIDNETHESGVTKCTTGEAWSAFSWHHSSVFHCQWTHNQVFLLLSHMLIWNAKSIFIYVMKYVSGFIWKLGINFAVCIKWIDGTWWNNRLLLVPNCYEVVAMVATTVAMVAPLWCHTLR